MNRRTAVCLSMIFAGLAAAAGCAQPIGANDFRRGEVGELSRVEEGTVLASRYVRMVGYKPLFRRDNNRNLGIAYVVRLDRTGETVSVTQGGDVALGAGAKVFVEFGDRVRIIPGPNPR